MSASTTRMLVTHSVPFTFGFRTTRSCVSIILFKPPSALYHKFCHYFWQFVFFPHHAGLDCGIWLTRLYNI